MTNQDTSPEAVERLIVWLMDAHETGNTEKNPDVWRTLEALSDALEAAEMSAKHWHARAKAAEAELAEAARLLKQAQPLVDPCYPSPHRDWQHKTRTFLAHHQKETGV